MKGEAWQGLIQKRIAQHFRQFHTHRDEGVGRRSFLRSTAGAAGLAFASGLVAPHWASGNLRLYNRSRFPEVRRLWAFLCTTIRCRARRCR